MRRPTALATRLIMSNAWQDPEFPVISNHQTIGTRRVGAATCLSTLRRRYTTKDSGREVLQLCRSALISLADMVLAPSVAGLFKWRQFEPEMILLAVGWYLRFSLSYRDVEELLAERGLLVDHVTVWRVNLPAIQPGERREFCQTDAVPSPRPMVPTPRRLPTQLRIILCHP